MATKTSTREYRKAEKFIPIDKVDPTYLTWEYVETDLGSYGTRREIEPRYHGSLLGVRYLPTPCKIYSRETPQDPSNARQDSLIMQFNTEAVRNATKGFFDMVKLSFVEYMLNNNNEGTKHFGSILPLAAECFDNGYHCTFDQFRRGVKIAQKSRSNPNPSEEPLTEDEIQHAGEFYRTHLMQLIDLTDNYKENEKYSPSRFMDITRYPKQAKVTGSPEEIAKSQRAVERGTRPGFIAIPAKISEAVKQKLPSLPVQTSKNGGNYTTTTDWRVNVPADFVPIFMTDSYVRGFRIRTHKKVDLKDMALAEELCQLHLVGTEIAAPREDPDINRAIEEISTNQKSITPITYSGPLDTDEYSYD